MMFGRMRTLTRPGSKEIQAILECASGLHELLRFNYRERTSISAALDCGNRRVFLELPALNLSGPPHKDTVVDTSVRVGVAPGIWSEPGECSEIAGDGIELGRDAAPAVSSTCHRACARASCVIRRGASAR